MFRREEDSVGVLDVPVDAYYGVNTQRAFDNFQITNQRLDETFIESLLEVKKASALANLKLNELPREIGEVIVKAIDDLLETRNFEDIIVDPIQGGAGTSTNMNVNEVIANHSIELLGDLKGSYNIISPTDHVNKGQSTNDVYPTAAKVTFLKLIDELLVILKGVAKTFQGKSEEFATIKKMGRTQLSDAIPITVGQEFAAYHMVTKRNIHRLEKVKAEIQAVNIGGTAIGTRMSAHPDLAKETTEILREITNLSVYEAEDLIDNTQNVEAFGVVSDCLKTIALSFSKIANDIRLLSSGPRTGIGELIIPAKQNGSSIMPGKINPVIPEVVNQSAFLVAGNSVTISMAIEAGQLELNAFEPVMYYKLTESFKVLGNALKTFDVNCLQGIQVNEVRCRELLEASTYLTTPLAKHIGYEKASKIAKDSLTQNKSVREVAEANGISQELLTSLTY